MKFGMLNDMTGIFADNAINSASISNRSTTCNLKGQAPARFGAVMTAPGTFGFIALLVFGAAF